MQWNKPKSVRQIGDIPGRGRIYMEDYVLRFAGRLSEQGKGMEKGAMLLGNTFLSNGEKIYQISGIVEIHGFASRTAPALSQDMWNRVYTEIKENFTDLEIVGWYYSCRDFTARDAAKLLEIHKQNFQHRDKVLCVYEAAEKEAVFFLYRNGQFERQKGYYIYYEKNPEMLHYMEKEAERHVHIVEQEDDRVVRNIRGIMEEKERIRQQGACRKNRENKLGYSLGVLAALIVVLVGVAAMRNQDTLSQVKKQVENLQELVMGEQTNAGRTMVETMGSNLVRLTATPAAADEAASPAAAVQPASGEGIAAAGQSPVAK